MTAWVKMSVRQTEKPVSQNHEEEKICKTDSLPQHIEYIFIAQLCQQNDNLLKLKIWTKSPISNS